MAAITFSDQELARIDSILSELDPASHDLMRPYAEKLEVREWELLQDYVRARLRRTLMTGLMAGAVTAVAEAEGLAYPGTGSKAFGRRFKEAWVDSFAPIPDCWRLAPVLARLEDGRSCVLKEILALEAMAENRMFETLDDQLAQLLES